MGLDPTRSPLVCRGPHALRHSLMRDALLVGQVRGGLLWARLPHVVHHQRLGVRPPGAEEAGEDGERRGGSTTGRTDDHPAMFEDPGPATDGGDGGGAGGKSIGDVDAVKLLAPRPVLAEDAFGSRLGYCRNTLASAT